MKKKPKSTSFINSLKMANNQLIAKKLPAWTAVAGLTFPTRLSLEQCSGSAAAHYKRQLIERFFPNGGRYMADLTGGLGVDFSALAPHFQKASYVERQAALCAAARHNFPLLGLQQAEIIEGDGVDFLQNMPEADLIFLDPARRDACGRKTVLIEDCEPDVVQLLPLIWLKTALLVVKLSPLLDLNRALTALPEVTEAHIVAERGECKELLLVLQRGQTGSTTIYCSDGAQQMAFRPEEEQQASVTYAPQPLAFLYEPNATLLKAGAFKLIAERYHMQKLHPNSHLYTADQWVPDFPGRGFRIVQVCGFGKKELRALCNTVDQANLTIRNFPGSVAELRKRLKLKEGGEAYWFATTLYDGKHVIIDCRKTTDSSPQS